MIRAVKKLLLILLITFLPLQYAWAAAAAYCQHEQETQQTSHIGHHTHQHQSTDEEVQEPNKSKQVHSDCGVCHFSAQVSFLATFVSGVPPNDVVHIAPLSPSYSSHIPDGPHKPDWHLVA
ncbi:cation efflux protein, CzcI family [Noviherbaspirillum album]|uniref:cation efflux protein, CzcI family n=1 Tax=Noviherbaspirillum album TaxID=3080276 RepID=UPI00346009A4